MSFVTFLVNRFRYPYAVCGFLTPPSSTPSLKHFFSEIVVYYPKLRPLNDDDLVVLLYHIS